MEMHFEKKKKIILLNLDKISMTNFLSRGGENDEEPEKVLECTPTRSQSRAVMLSTRRELGIYQCKHSGFTRNSTRIQGF